MKELTIEEKAKRYDEAIERAEKWRNAPNADKIPTFANRIIDEIFPEFEENEDEKIRKEIIDFLELPHPQFVGKRDHKTWITWLEKQRNKKDNLSVDLVLGCLGIKPAYKDGNAWCILLGDNIQEGICGFGGTKEEALIAFIKELIEERDKKSADKLKVSNELYEHIRNTYTCIYNACSPNTFTAMTNYLLTAARSAESALYMIENQDEKEQDPCEHCNDKLLNCHNFPCIKKKAFEQGKSILEVINDINDKRYCCVVTPQDKSALESTKEKVDNADKVEPKFKIGDTIINIYHKCYGNSRIKEITDGRYIFDDRTYIFIKEQDNYELVKQKPWSEEDEYTLNETIQHLEELIRIDIAKHCGCDVQYYQRDIDWLKDIKDRVQSQNTWKPSEKMLEALDIAIRSGIQLGSWEEKALRELQKQLKAL